MRDGRLDPDDVVEPTGNVAARRDRERLPAAQADRRGHASTRRCGRTSGTTSSWRATRRWASGRATTSRSRAPPSRQTVEGLVRANALMNGTFELGGEKVDLQGDHAPGAQHHGRARPHRPAGRRRAAARPRRLEGEGGAAAGRRPRRPRGGAQGREGDAARHCRLVQGALRGGDADPRASPTQTSTRCSRFFERVPESERTFFKEPVLDRATVEGWLTGERGRRGLAFADDGRVVGYVAVIRLTGWSDHVGEAAAGRRSGGARPGARPRARPLGAAAGARVRPEEAHRRGRGRAGGCGRDVRRRSASRPRGCCATTCATATASCAT